MLLEGTARQLFDSVYEGMIITTMDGRIEDMNARAVALLKLDREDVLNSTIFGIVSGLDEATLRNAASSLREHEHILIEAHCMRKDGSSFPAEIALHRMDLSGHPQLCFSIRDVTNREEVRESLKEAQEALFESERQKARAQTIAALAHEINNPLQVLMGMVEADRNQKYAAPLNRIVTVMQEMRLNEATKAGYWASAPVRSSIPPPDLAKCRTKSLLVVDDEPALTHFFRSILSAKLPDLKIETASNGRDAVELFKAEHHAIIILDISMPVMSGEEAFLAISRFCRENKWEMPAVLFCTGYTPPESVRRAIAAEPLHAYLPKPVTSETLLNAVRNRLEFFALSHQES